MTLHDLPPDKTYGDYHCTRLLGATSDGAVYLAHRTDDETSSYALRTLDIPKEKLGEVLTECDNHMSAIKAISAPHLVPVLDYGHVENEYFLVMPFVQGESLLHLLNNSDKTPQTMPSLGEILELVVALGEALTIVHDMEHAHGAIEPRNILITPEISFYLADIGLSRLTKIVFSLQTTSSFWAGTYTAPEVWLGERNTASTDQYSLACVIYHLVTGREPFNAKTIFGMMEKHQNAIVTPPHYIRKDAPADLTMFFLHATAKTPPERFRSITELVDEFGKAIVGHEGEPTGFFNINS